MLNSLLIAGMIIVTGALVLYSTAFKFELKLRNASNRVFYFFIGGVCLDIASTTCMILGSRRMPITLHGMLGYSALAAMITDAVLLYDHRKKKGYQERLPGPLYVYSVAAYIWWVAAFLAGGMLVMVQRHH